MAGNARRTRIERGSAGPCLGPADESSSARLPRALRGTAVEGAVPPQMGPSHRSSSGEAWHHALGEQIDLLRIVRHGAEDEILEPGADEVGDARIDPVDAARHVAFLKVFPGPVSAHGPDEWRPALLERLVS